MSAGLLQHWCHRLGYYTGEEKYCFSLMCYATFVICTCIVNHSNTGCLLHRLPVLRLMGQIMYQMASHNRDSLTQSRFLCRGVVTESGNVPLHLNNIYLWEAHRGMTRLPARVGPGDEMLSYRKHVKLRELELSWSNSPFRLSTLRGWPAQ